MAGDKPAVQTLTCPGCGASLTITAVGQTLTLACKSCFNILDVSQPGVATFIEAQKKMKRAPLIPLGARGKLRGELFEVIGFMVRCDASGAYEWEEYLLFNPYKGFRWLTQFGGHWNFVMPLKNRPKEYEQSAAYLDRSYRQFINGSATVRFVLGEFYWRVSDGEKVRVIDFIHPPEIISKEWDKSEENWSLGTYIEPEDLQRAFAVKTPFPPKQGVAPNQPSSWSGSYEKIRNVMWLAAAVMLIIQILVAASAPNTVVFKQDYTPPYFGTPLGQSPSPTSIITPSFDIDGRKNNLQVHLASPVNNSWFEIQADLVNDETGESMEFEHGVEYWSGYDDGYWSEGSTASSMLIADVPAGKYHLVIDPVPASQTLLPFALELRRGVPVWGNFLFCLGLLAIFPLVAFWRFHRFEYQRWSESDDSPYAWLEGD